MHPRPLAALALAAGLLIAAVPAAAQPSAADSAIPAPPQPAILPAVPEVAPGYAAPDVHAPAGELIGVAQQPFVGIKLEDAIAMALGRNLDLALAQSNRRIAGYQIVAAQGAYDIRFQLQPSLQHQLVAPASAFQAGPGGGPITQDTAGISGSYNGLAPGGGSFTVGTSAQRVITDSTVASFSPQYLTSVALQFTQPLLRNAATDGARRQVQIAGANAEQQNAATLAVAEQVVANVSNAYWDLVAAWRNVAIQEEGLRNAQAQAASTRRLAQQGAAAPVDTVESFTQINAFQDNVLSALLNVQRLQTQLKTLILGNPADPAWSANLVPTSNVGVVPPEPKLDDLVVQALVHRPEVAQLRAARRTVDANIAYATDQTKPELDLGLGVTSNGFSGTPTSTAANPFVASLGAEAASINALIARANAAAAPGSAPIPPLTLNFAPTPSYLTGGLGTSISALLQNRFPTYTLNLTLQLPFRNRAAKAQLEIAREQGRQLEVQELGLLQRIRAEAGLALQTLRETEYRLVAARDARVASERVLTAEQRRFSAGTSTTFLVLQRQLDLANQRGRELQAQTDLNKAVVELNRVSGSLLAASGFDVDRAGAQTLDLAKPNVSALASPPPPRR